MDRGDESGVVEGLRQGATHLVTLNDDTVPARELLENLVCSATAVPQALIGAYALDAETGEPVYGGETIRWATASYQSHLGADARRVEVTHFPGRGLLIPAEVFRRIGLFSMAITSHRPRPTTTLRTARGGRATGSIATVARFCGCTRRRVGIQPTGAPRDGGTTTGTSSILRGAETSGYSSGTPCGTVRGVCCRCVCRAGMARRIAGCLSSG